MRARANLRRAVVAACAVLLAACGDAAPASGAAHKVRVGHFPNVTHAQGLVGHGSTRSGHGFFEERLGPDFAVEWSVYNAGPNAMEALLAGSLDLAYVGPSPALNSYVKSKGDEVRIVAGAARGGAALVVQGDGRIAAPADFKGKKIATPQLGNTQDVACRAWLVAQGIAVTATGGDATVLPMQNPEILASFAKGDVDAAWTVEPWVSRLETDAKGKVFLEEKDATTTVLVASARFLRESPDVAKKFAGAHDELTKWIAEHSDEAREKARVELGVETRHEVPPDAIARAWPRLAFDSSISVDVFEKFVSAAKTAGFMKDAGDLSRLVDTSR
jgi:NitT/TauT family transport system substrate-binding protein